MEKEELIKKIASDFTYWYHRIDLGGGVITPGFHYEPLWDNIREVRKGIDYKDKLVLDLAAFDGMFSFEAEKLGAKTVIATDCLYRSFRNFLFCKEVLGSKCLPYYNISPYKLFDRLDVFFQENYDNEKPYDRLFDIVQHLGLLYHLRDPMLSLSQVRSCLKTGGMLLIESNAVLNSDEAFMLYNGIPSASRITDNFSVWWNPTIKCLKEMLTASLFTPVESSVRAIDYDQPLWDRNREVKTKPHGINEGRYKLGRVCMIAKATDPSNVNSEFLRELVRTYRNPGMDLRQVNK